MHVFILNVDKQTKNDKYLSTSKKDKFDNVSIYKSDTKKRTPRV